MTAEFSEKSTNSWVALNGSARLIRNTRQRVEGVSYYECSGRVRSELCVPIFRYIKKSEEEEEKCRLNPNYCVDSFHLEVIGIIDLESWKEDHFTSTMILDILKISLDIGSSDYFLNSVWFS